MLNITQIRMKLTAGGLSGSSAFMRALACAALVAIVPIALTACKSTVCYRPSDTTYANMITGKWSLVEVNREPLRSAWPNLPINPTLQIGSDGSLSGFAGVNRFSSKIDLAALEERRWKSGSISVTKRAGPADLMELERQVLHSLRYSRAAILEDSMLELTWQTDPAQLGGRGSVTLVYERAE